MTYICDCGRVEEWSDKDFADKGEPVCPDCDDDMRPMTDKEFKEYGKKMEKESWSNEMRSEAINDFGSSRDKDVAGVGANCETLSPLKGKTFTVIVGGEEEDHDLNFDELVSVLSSYSDFFRFTKEEQEKEVAYWIEEGEIHIDEDQKARIN